MTPEPDPHPASARGPDRRDDVRELDPAVALVRLRSPWVGDRHVDKTENAVDELVADLRGVTSLVWGGDWNHALTGKEYAGSIGGRRAVLGALDRSGSRRRRRTCRTRSTAC